MWGNLTFIQKIFFIINLGVGLTLLFAYLLPFIPPKYFEYATLSVFTPLLLIINIFFIFLWILLRKWNFIFSSVLFLVGLPFIHRFIQFSGGTLEQGQLSLMSFNVRLMNHYQWSKDTTLREKIIDFLKEEHPHIVALQEFYKKESESFPFYKYKKFIYKNNTDKIGQAILSDYPIIGSGSLDFPHTGNNGIFADIIVGRDTLRLYSLHFESFHIDDTEFTQENSRKILLSLHKRFAIQQSQVELFSKHASGCPYPIIVTLPSLIFIRKYKIKGLSTASKNVAVDLVRLIIFLIFLSVLIIFLLILILKLLLTKYIIILITLITFP